MLRNQWLVLAGFILLCLAVGGLGGWVTAQSVVDWYPTLIKPSWNPPNWIFGPVWTTLYVLMAIAAWLVWRGGGRTGGAMVLFFSQLALNFAWSFLFFGARSPWLGLVDIAMLWVALLLTAIAFFQRSRLAGTLMLPYLAWVSFAAVLNFAIWRLN
ncbi:MAG: tryptophan-rich sensory protein [Alphaproteobacteria bacterium]|nr:tryptophan-rich sensory protein [Alphaproteobacteria bacterium]